MNFRTEFLIYVVLFYLLSFALGFAGMKQLLRGDEQRAIIALVGAVACLLMPLLLVRMVTGEDDDDRDKPE